MLKRVHFKHPVLPYVLVTPQIAVTLVFFVWPAGQALWQSMLVENAFGGSTRFVWFQNFREVFTDPQYLNSVKVTTVFTVAVTALGMCSGLFLATMADRVIRFAGGYRTLLVMPYAVAPAVAGVLWLFMFNPTVGILAYLMHGLGISWNPLVNGTDAMVMVIVAAAWKQVSYNFVFFLAGLQSIPRSLIEAAAIDGAGPFRRFWTVIFPLLSPTTFFLLVINVVYAFFETFAVIHATTAGGPANATTIMVYKVYKDGFVGLDLGGSAAQSVILMLLVIALTVIQFRYVEKRVEYGR